jgi:hypothetical protein
MRLAGANEVATVAGLKRAALDIGASCGSSPVRARSCFHK